MIDYFFFYIGIPLRPLLRHAGTLQVLEDAILRVKLTAVTTERVSLLIRTVNETHTLVHRAIERFAVDTDCPLLCSRAWSMFSWDRFFGHVFLDNCSGELPMLYGGGVAATPHMICVHKDRELLLGTMHGRPEYAGPYALLTWGCPYYFAEIRRKDDVPHVKYIGPATRQLFTFEQDTK